MQVMQFSKVDIKQNTGNISTVILSIKFLFYQWDPHHLQGSHIVYIHVHVFVCKTKSVLYVISNHIFCIYQTLGYILFW